MKIFENEILLESYKDFARIWMDVTGRDISFPNAVEAMLKDKKKLAIIKASHNISHIANRVNITDPSEITRWIAGVRDFARGKPSNRVTISFTNVFYDIQDEIENTIERNTPRYETIKRTSAYTVFRIDNFAAARDLRNKAGASWCIGANESYFDSYGKNVGRETYYIYLPRSKSTFVVHHGSQQDSLITSFDNNEDWSMDSSGSVTAMRARRPFFSYIKESLTEEELLELFSSVFGVKLHNVSRETRKAFADAASGIRKVVEEVNKGLDNLIERDSNTDLFGLDQFGKRGEVISNIIANLHKINKIVDLLKRQYGRQVIELEDTTGKQVQHAVGILFRKIVDFAVTLRGRVKDRRIVSDLIAHTHNWSERPFEALYVEGIEEVFKMIFKTPSADQIKLYRAIKRMTAGKAGSKNIQRLVATSFAKAFSPSYKNGDLPTEGSTILTAMRKMGLDEDGEEYKGILTAVILLLNALYRAAEPRNPSAGMWLVDMSPTDAAGVAYIKRFI